MLKLTTQDGRTIELHRWDNPFFGAPRINHHYNEVYCTLLDEADKPIKYHGTIGRYFDESKAEALVTALRKAWASDANEFTMPQDTDPDPVELFDDFCEKHGLTLATADETAIGLKGGALGEARRIARETDYWERRNVLIADENGDYSKSLAKWKALHTRKVA